MKHRPVVQYGWITHGWSNRRIRTLAILAVTIAMAGAAPSQAFASPAAPTGNGKPSRLVGIDSLPAADQARQRAQEALLNLNNRVYDLTATSYDAQFAGAQMDVQHHALAVYWAGAVPPALSSLRNEAARSGITLTVNPARFSRKQLMAAADQVMPTAEMPATVELAVDGSGLTVVAGDLPTAVRGTRAATLAESRLMQRIADTRSRSGVPITVAAAAHTGVPEFASTRHADTSPYWAGAQIVMPSGSWCTSGFSMYASGSTSMRYTLTAAHCPGYTDGVPIANGANASMGWSDFVHELYDGGTSYDLGVVRLESGKTNAPYIYIGEDSSAGAIPVSGYASGGILAGGTYCIHGMTAINCNLRSGGTVRQCTGWPPEGRCVYTIAMSAVDRTKIILCKGDSGGPIYYWSGGTVIAAGATSWGYVSWNSTYNNYCAYDGGVSVVATAVNTIPGLRVVTTSAP